MTLIKSISGIRGTIGGKPQENLTPLDATQFAAAYAQWLHERHPQADKLRVVIGRDARPSGPLLQALVQNTLLAAGIDVVDLDLATTPTVEMAVPRQKAQGGIILTASHNPVEWNALKLLDERGEFIDAQAGAALLKMIEAAQFSFAPVDKLGRYHRYETALEDHIEAILALPYVRAEAIRRAGFKVAVDAVAVSPQP
jgi:phosphomannomutase